MYPVFRNNIYTPFVRIGFVCIFLSYVAFITYNITTPGYIIEAFFTNPSFFVALRFLSVYLVLASLVILTVAAVIYAYIEIGRYKQQVAYLTEDRKLLEVRLPEDTQETLSSMEAVLEMIAYTGGEGLWFPVWWFGKKRPMYSFEIVSKGGIVSFLIHTRANLAPAVMSAIYAFYPRAQVNEVDDYTHDFEYDKEKVSVFSFEWKLLQDNNPLPIKTYVEFQLERYPGTSGLPPDVVGSAMQPTRPLVDPLAPLYDLFGSIGGDEQLWVQYVFRAQKYARSREDVASDPVTVDYWNKQKLPDEIRDALFDLEKRVKEGRAADTDPAILSSAERRLQAIGPRLIEKQAVEVGIRMMYVTPAGSFNPARLAPLTAVYKLTNADENALIPHGTLLTDKFEVPALEPPRQDKEAEKQLLLQLYRDRLFWYAPALFMYQISDGKRWSKTVEGPTRPRIASVMTTETLATICHFPTVYVKTPTVKRILSTTVEPPENLPV
ncbi:MAG: hypothetical protein OYG31_01055 [Candidatus Kaiserbacteria bacterium]|nr:hypothetical protein [Candidatus Kaiserbacteria bacterium]